MQSSRSVRFALQDDQDECLRAFCEQHGISMSALARAGLRMILQKHGVDFPPDVWGQGGGHDMGQLPGSVTGHYQVRINVTGAERLFLHQSRLEHGYIISQMARRGFILAFAERGLIYPGQPEHVG